MRASARLAAIVLILLAGCMSGSSFVARSPAYIDVRAVDLTRFSREGFLITPGEYAGEYSAIGIVETEQRPRVRALRGGRDGVFRTNDWSYEAEMLDIDALVNRMHEKAVTMGADAVMHFGIESIPGDPAAGILDGAVVYGFAIKRAGTP